jgi:hypothetical protein
MRLVPMTGIKEFEATVLCEGEGVGAGVDVVVGVAVGVEVGAVVGGGVGVEEGLIAALGAVVARDRFAFENTAFPEVRSHPARNKAGVMSKNVPKFFIFPQALLCGKSQ